MAPAGMSYAFIEAPRWLFLGLVVCAPWAYGCTHPWAVRALDLGLVVVLLMWLDGCLLRRALPALHRWSIAVVLLLIIQGWWMALNPHFLHDPATHTFLPLAAPVAWAPGTVDRAASMAFMLRVTVLLGAILFVSDLARQPTWRQRLFLAIGIVGMSVAFLGLLQRVSGAEMIFWADRPSKAPFFATFFYAGNAGAFLNLVLLPVAAQAVLAIRDPDAHVRRAIWIPGWLACLAAVFVNTSRVGQLIACVLTAAFLSPKRGRR
jgi:hypothetical protein